ncbi:MAG: hypothetical protein EB101_04960 [Chitinophagia bacterium]|nr:hypothetical protein [Chitinophagia bacterium]
MTSILTITILGAIYLNSADKAAEKSVNTTPRVKKSIVNATKLPQTATLIEEEELIKKSTDLNVTTDSTAALPIYKMPENPISPNENKVTPISISRDIPDTTVIPVSAAKEANSGNWKSVNDSLSIDTIFNGVKKLIFTGYINKKAVIAGSKRNNVSMSYSYNYKAKGIFVGNSQCEVRYKKIDSVLTIQIDRKSTVNVGVSFIKLTSGILFEVPENIAIDINTSYGDIEIRNLVNNAFQVKTAYGDIEAKSIVGTPKLLTNYGDIILDRISGNIEIGTAYGDIKGANITALESVVLKSNYGDIDLQITNPISDCKLELKTGYGKIKVKRNDLEIESTKKLIFGTGRVKISAATSYGNVILK